MQLQAALVLIILFFFLLAMSVPVSFSIITSALITIIMFLTPQFGMFISAQKLVSGIDSFTLLAVPFFILAGQLIPPTNAFIVYSAASGGASVATLFMAGWIPGLLWAFLCMVVAFLYAKKQGYVVKREKLTGAEAAKVVWDAIPSLLLIVIIIGGILSGYFTPTEASGVAVIYAFILSAFVYKSIKLKDLKDILVDAAVMTTIVMLIIGASSVLSFVLSFTGLPQAISSLMLGVSDNKIVILLLINIILLIVGTFMDMAPALLIFTPIFLPVITNIGMDPIQFGVMMVMNLSIGTVTPPVGSVLFVGCSVAKLKVEDVVSKLIPYFAAILAALLFVTFVPAFSTWLPTVLGLM